MHQLTQTPLFLYHASDMVLMTDTDDAYLILPTSCIRILGHCPFINCILDYSKGNPNPNFPIWTECKTLKAVVSSPAESEIGGTFENA